MQVSSTGVTLEHWGWVQDGPIGYLTIRNPNERFNLLTMDSYAEGVAFFKLLTDAASEANVEKPEYAWARTLQVIIIDGEDGHVGDRSIGTFCAGGSPKAIVKPLVDSGSVHEMQRFTKMTVDLIRYMINCPQMTIAAVDGVCAGAGAAIAAAANFRIGTPRAKVKLLFNQMGLSGADMGVMFFMNKLIGPGSTLWLCCQGRDAKLEGDVGLFVGFFQATVKDGESVLEEARSLARKMIEMNSPTSLAATKVAYYRHLGDVDAALDIDERLQGLVMTGGPDMKIACEAFLADGTSSKPDYSSAPRRAIPDDLQAIWCG